mgnify:CR=1 FL=1
MRENGALHRLLVDNRHVLVGEEVQPVEIFGIVFHEEIKLRFADRDNLFALLGKPGYEDQKAELEAKLN